MFSITTSKIKFNQDLCKNLRYDLWKVLELNPRVRCAFGNYFRVRPINISSSYLRREQVKNGSLMGVSNVKTDGNDHNSNMTPDERTVLCSNRIVEEVKVHQRKKLHQAQIVTMCFCQFVFGQNHVTRCMYLN